MSGVFSFNDKIFYWNSQQRREEGYTSVNEKQTPPPCFDDLVLGAPGHDGAAGNETGKVYIYSGQDQSHLSSIEGSVINERWGQSIK